MAKLTFPTDRTIPLPILIDAEQLRRLDQIVDQSIPKLREERDRRLDSELEADIADDLKRGFLKKEQITAEYREKLKKQWMLRRSWGTEQRSVTISLSRGREVEVETFAQAESHSQSQHEVPLGFSCHAAVGPATLQVGLNSPWSRALVIQVKPSDGQAVQDVFGSIINWANDVRAPQWQHLWRELQGLFSFFLMMVVILGSIVVPLSVWGEGAKSVNKAEARKLLQQGVNPSNQLRALELLLAIESEYSPPGLQRPSLGVRYWSYVLLLTAFLVVASITPKYAIGLWKGKENLRLWKVWIGTVTVTIPGLLITFVALPWLLYWLHLTPPTP